MIDQTRVAVFNMLVRCIFGSSLPQPLPIPGLDQPFDRLAETAIATAAGYATEIECARPTGSIELSILCAPSLD
jgi:hypothetical protein